MKKMVTIATAGVFLLSLQGAVLAQKEEKAPAPPPMMEKQTPATPKAEAPPAAKAPEVKPAETKSKAKATKKAKTKKTRTKKAKKKAAPEE